MICKEISMKILKSILLACLMISFAASTQRDLWAQEGDGVPPSQEVVSADTLTQLSHAFESLSKRVQRAVVQVLVVRFSLTGAGVVPSSARLGLEHGGGSGTIVSEDGYILTNAHVVGNAREIRVVLASPTDEGATRRSILRPKGKIVNARVIGKDEETDIAVLKIDEERLPHLAFGDSEDLEQGQVVLAFGSPLGLENSVTMGVVSSVARQLESDAPMIYIQTDAPINPGNSGGPLVSTAGQVVGINTLIFSQSGGNEGIGFAAPSNIVRHVYEEIVTHGRVRRGHIGLNTQTIEPLLAEGLGLAQDWGVVVADVYPGQPASSAGLRPGDAILALDGKVIENARQFDVNVYQRAPGDYLTLDLLRDLQQLSLRVQVVELEDDSQRFSAMVTPEDNHIERLEILAVDIDAEIAQMLPSPRKLGGVLVAATTDDAGYWNGGLLPGDVIHGLNGRSIPGLSALRSELGGMDPGDALVFHVQRQDKLIFVASALKRRTNEPAH
jgi:serine protease Do